MAMAMAMAGTEADEPRLELTVRTFTDPTRWDWVLTDADGNFLADHEVRLDGASWQYEAFTDLLKYLSWHVTADRKAEDEARIVGELGTWITAQVLGPIADHLAARRPVTVTVALPDEASALAYCPLELADAGGKPLAAQGVTFVLQPGAARPGKPAEVRGRLRVLGLFSLPDGGQPLNLRRERHALVRLIQATNATGKAADARALQYGVTRERLQAALEEAEGWDVIHVSGHGAPGELLLENPDGRPDQVSADDLAELLELARPRVKLVTLSACWSASPTAADQRRLLGLPIDTENAGPYSTGNRASLPAAPSSAAMATRLADRLGCAVLAMRYPVDDDFAIALSEKLYELLADRGQELSRAVGLTLRHLARTYPPLAVATPTLVSLRPAGLSLAAPDRAGAQSYATSAPDLKLAGFPPSPDRFVGRTAVMARASAALAARSGIPGVLLHGMPGGGKTACALELAYGHAHAFDKLVWYKAPDDGRAIDGALTDLALTLERYLGDFQMAHVLTSAESLAAFLPRLTELMEHRRLLLVLDNAESLLTEVGHWRDERWAKVFEALLAHQGLGRLLLTSRRVPAALAAPAATEVTGATTAGTAIASTSAGATGRTRGGARVRVLPVDALSADEALLLARELPDLRRLVYGQLPGLDRDTSRRLARGVLAIAQGHPKLLELANGQAGQPERLAALIETGDQAWREQGGLPDRFFAAGETAAGSSAASPANQAASEPGQHGTSAAGVQLPAAGTTGESAQPESSDPATADHAALGTADATGGTQAAGDYWHVLAAWTNAVAGTLAPGERDLFWFLCCLEEPDRERWVLDNNWGDLWRRLGRDGEAPDLGTALAAVAATGLAAAQPAGQPALTAYAVHPGVAEAGRERAGTPFRDAADAEAGAFWAAVYQRASGAAGDGRVDTGLMVRAGLAAVPYLIRQQQWTLAAYLLQRAFLADPSRANAAAVLPAITLAARHDPRQADVLALVLRALDPVAAEAVLRGALDAAVTAGDHTAASVAAGRLADWCRDSGRLAEALDLTQRTAGYTRQAGLGPWTQLSDQARRLQVLNEMGQASHVLAEVTRLRAHMATLPATPGPGEAITPWSARETLLGIGRHAAIRLGRWDDALDLNAAIAASKRDRNAPATSTAITRYNDHGPLLRVGRTREALELLQDCLRVFQDAHDTANIGKTLTALADSEHRRGHGQAAIRLERDALRHAYLAGDVAAIAISYHNHGLYLASYTDQPAQALASHLTATLIFTLIGSGYTAAALEASATDLRELGSGSLAPGSVADLDRELGAIEGTNLPGLIKALSPDPETAERTLRDLIRQAAELAAAPPAEPGSGS